MPSARLERRDANRFWKKSIPANESGPVLLSAYGTLTDRKKKAPEDRISAGANAVRSEARGELYVELIDHIYIGH
jgi:hypothetical protein